ncbi:MAG: M3 family oligoendopeptidase [Chloroflexota bacterium]|nr:MAG: M3 family oligoendopeptidase [Chloroflexota bacterium]
METYPQTRWDLSALLQAPSGEPVERALNDIETRTTNFEAAREKLTPEMDEEEFLDLVKEYEGLNRELRKIGYYAELWFSEDTQNQNALAFKTKIEQLSTQVANRVLFFSLWWKEIDDANAARLMRNAGDYTYFLESERMFKPHTLSESEEQVINLKDVNGMGGLLTVYDMLTNKYVFQLTVNGEEKELTYGELMVYSRHPDPALRAAVYKELYRVYGEDGGVLAQIYASRINDWKSEQVDLRHFKTPIAARNLGNDVPDAAVDTMLEVCKQNATVFQRYFKLKAKWLGLNPMRRSDIYAPLAPVDTDFPWNEGVTLVLDSFEKFSPRLAAEARSVFDAGHVDSEIRPGKRSGAFCASALPELAPFVQINYAGKARDVATLAHELGHAIHARMAREHSALTFHSALPMAETASVFAEMILNERLLRDTNDVLVKRDILARMMDDAYATVMRQAFFAMFEKTAHEAFNNGATADEVRELYWENLKTQFGDALEIQEDFKWEWVVIQHFYHVPFYVYAYSFGQLLTLALYKRYREQGEAFKPNYFKILAYGGSASPQHILKEAEIDITSAAFWQGGFDVISEFIDQLEGLES